MVCEISFTKTTLSAVASLPAGRQVLSASAGNESPNIKDSGKFGVLEAGKEEEYPTFHKEVKRKK